MANPGKRKAAGGRLAAPSELGQAAIAEHLRSRHGIEPFDLARHVYLGDRRLRSQLISWDPAKARYRCELCPGSGFSTGEITAEQVQVAQMFDPGLQPFLAGAGTLERRDEITRSYLDGSLAEGLARASGKLKRHTPAQPRPSVEHRKRRVQQWMLERYAERGVVERVIEEAVVMQRDDLPRWLELAGAPLAASTLRRYWQEIDDREVAGAKAAFLRRQRK